MNKRMREILAQIQAKTAEAKSYMNGENKDVAKATELMDEVDALQKEYDAEKRIFETEKANGAESANAVVEDTANAKTEKTESVVAKFAKAVRSIIQGKGLTEGVAEDGGYTVPEDVSTKVEQYKDVSYSLLQDIDVVPVSTNKGSRTYQKKGDADAFVDIDENGEITNEIEAPKFERLPYAIQDRAGFMPVSNDLVNDSDANILDIVAQWLAKANVATANKKVLALVATKAQVDFKGINGIKHALNVTLGQAYKDGAKIYTNDDGLNYLDTLVDENGRPMLNPDPTDSAKLTLRCGTTVLPIKVLPNKVFKSEGTKVPFVVGNLFDFARKYDRQSMSIMASTTASIGNFNAFAQNMTVLRAIVRDDYRVKDVDSIVNGYIDTSVVGE